MNILITGGPTNEYIDEVMKITNMSTGSLSRDLTELFLDNGDSVCLVLNNNVNIDKLMEHHNEKNLSVKWIETTQDMLEALKDESQKQYDVLIHAAAVGDYTGAFSFLMEDLAEELYKASIRENGFKSSKEILDILVNPKSKLNDDSKISSYQENLTVKLGLTPKIIARLREWFPNSKLFACKLLDKVSKEELYEVAAKLCKKNDMDYILANDLHDLRNGDSTRYLVDKDGYTNISLATPKEIFEFIIR